MERGRSVLLQEVPDVKRANFIGVPEFFNLNQVCCVITNAFGTNPYLVGSSLERRDYRDVDIRLILDDSEFDRLFQGASGNMSYNAFYCLLCASISEWISTRTRLPIDFQIQRQTEANAEHPGPRSAIGIFLESRKL